MRDESISADDVTRNSTLAGRSSFKAQVLDALAGMKESTLDATHPFHTGYRQACVEAIRWIEKMPPHPENTDTPPAMCTHAGIVSQYECPYCHPSKSRMNSGRHR